MNARKSEIKKIQKVVLRLVFLMSLVFFCFVFFLTNAFSWTPPTANPTANDLPRPVHVGTDAQTKAGDLFFSGGTRSTGTSSNNDFRIRTNGLDRISILAGGNVGIGQTTASYKLHVSGDVGASAYYYTSDFRLKENIKPLENSLLKILELDPISYRLKGTQNQRLGFSAQQVQKFFPELVNMDNQGFLSIDGAGLTAPLVESIKEQQEQIEKQKAEIDELREQIEKLSQELSELK